MWNARYPLEHTHMHTHAHTHVELGMRERRSSRIPHKWPGNLPGGRGGVLLPSSIKAVRLATGFFPKITSQPIAQKCAYFNGMLKFRTNTRDGSNRQLTILEGRELLAFHPPFTWESGVKVWPISSTNYREKRKPELDLRAGADDSCAAGEGTGSSCLTPQCRDTSAL